MLDCSAGKNEELQYPGTGSGRLSQSALRRVSHAAVLHTVADENGIRCSTFRRCRLKPELQTKGIFMEVLHELYYFTTADETDIGSLD